MRTKHMTISILMLLVIGCLLMGCSGPASKTPDGQPAKPSVETTQCGNSVVDAGEECDDSDCPVGKVCEDCSCVALPPPPALPE